jgi:hypothetical protein
MTTFIRFVVKVVLTVSKNANFEGQRDKALKTRNIPGKAGGMRIHL